MSYDELHHEIGQIKGRLESLEIDMKSMSQLKDDVRFIKDRTVLRDEQISSLHSSNLRIEMLLRGDYGSEGLVQKFAKIEGKVSEHDKKMIWAMAAFTTLAAIFQLLSKVIFK